MAEAKRERLLYASLAALVVLSVAYRLPALVDAGTVDADAAIVGLQARHILHGEWSWLLYGSGYQTSVDSCVAALFFALFGATPLALVLSTLTGHIALTCLAFGTLRRRVPTVSAFVATLPLVFTSSPLHTYILSPPRQAALTLAFAAIFVVDSAAERPTRPLRLAHHALGAALGGLAVFADPYALLLFPALLLLDALVAWGDRRAILACVTGGLVGLVPFLLLLGSPRSVHGEATLTLAVAGHNARLLIDPCLPWLLGATAYVPHALLGYSAWEPGVVATVLQGVGGASFLVAVLAGGLVVRRREIPWKVRRLGLFGVLVAGLTLGSFLVSTMVMDLFSSRYLAALVLASPFALAPLAYLLGARTLFLGLVPYLAGAGLAGWLGYGDEVRGPRIVALPGGGAQDEEVLEEMLVARGIHEAIADYWVSYRLTFLYGEAVKVVPLHAKEDRYAPYRAAYAEATKVAYIFDPQRSREDLAAMEKEAFAGTAPWGTPGERLHAGSLVAVVFDKARGAVP